MLKIATSGEMQRIDRKTIDEYGISGTVLMERAGLSVVSRINELYPDRDIIVLCGGGNNGGDGLVIARVLHNQGRNVKVFLAATRGTLKGDAGINYSAAKKFGVPIAPMKHFLSRSSPRGSRNCLMVDALLGTGLIKNVRTPLSDVIIKVNRMSSPVMSVDIPSGISSDNGRIMGYAVKAHCTVTFGLPKRGHLLHPGAGHRGQLFIEDIGFPRTLLESGHIRIHMPEKRDILKLLPARPECSHKGSYGHVLIVAGSKGKTGAALMAARACLRTGAGLVTIAIPESLLKTFQSRVTEEMILPLPDTGKGTVSMNAANVILDFLGKRGNVLALGPGLSVDREISRLVSILIRESRAPLVIDADGLNAIAGHPGVLKKSRMPVIITPHAGEMARLLKKRSEVSGQRSGKPELSGLREDIEGERINAVQVFAKKNKCYVVLKGAPTVTAEPGGKAFINSTGNAGMATAGTGDVLTGMISAFLAQGLSPQNAAILGVYMHGLTGDIVSEKKGQISLIASDIVKAIPDAVVRFIKP